MIRQGIRTALLPQLHEELQAFCGQHFHLLRHKQRQHRVHPPIDIENPNMLHRVLVVLLDHSIEFANEKDVHIVVGIHTAAIDDPDPTFVQTRIKELFDSGEILFRRDCIGPGDDRTMDVHPFEGADTVERIFH